MHGAVFCTIVVGKHGVYSPQLQVQALQQWFSHQGFAASVHRQSPQGSQLARQTCCVGCIRDTIKQASRIVLPISCKLRNMCELFLLPQAVGISNVRAAHAGLLSCHDDDAAAAAAADCGRLLLLGTVDKCNLRRGKQLPLKT